MKKLFFICLIGLSLNLLAEDPGGKKWLLSQDKNIRGVAFIMHGLNTKPSAMDFLGQYLNKKGIHVLRGALTGHFGNVDDFVSRDIWLNDTKEAYAEALEKSQKLKVPLYFVGYSLGALLFMDMVSNSEKKIEVEKMILFSPAFSIAAYLRFFSFIFYLPGSFKLPSRNLEEYRSSDYTTFYAYDALWKSYGRIDWQKVRPPKALIIMDERDELVSFSGVEYLVKKIPGWELFEVDTSGSRNSRQYHHLTFNDACYAEGVWGTIEERMENFLWPKPGTR